MLTKVILSSDDNPYYLDFWPLVKLAWEKVMGITPTLILITDKDEYKSTEDIIIRKPIPGVPNGNLAKVARFIYASYFREDVVLVNDIDLIPLAPWYWQERLSQRKPGELLIVTSDRHYQGKELGKFPIGDLTAEGSIFQQIMNPLNFSFEGLVEWWKGFHIFDDKEDIKGPNFSDESLWRAMLFLWKPSSIKIRRVEGLLYPFSDRVIDRANWSFDLEKLYQGYYYSAHMLRPYSEYEEQIRPIEVYLKDL